MMVSRADTTRMLVDHEARDVNALLPSYNLC
jgi:hypothetical protein